MERIKLDEFLQYHFLSNVRLSPNAKKAAFVVSRANEAKDGYDAGIWTADLESRQCRQLTAGKDERSFVWLDDPDHLFTSKRDSKKEDVDSFYTDCFQISLTGGEARKVMTLPAPVEALEKLNDDTWLLCVDYDGSLPEDFFPDEPGEPQKAAGRPQEGEGLFGLYRAALLEKRRRRHRQKARPPLSLPRQGAGTGANHRPALSDAGLFRFCGQKASALCRQRV